MLRSSAACCCLAIASAGVAAAADRLPSRFSSQAARTTESVSRHWTPQDIVGVRSITDLAVSQNGRRVAFIIKQSFPDSADIRFGLYLIDKDRTGTATKIKEASYMADLAAHPGTNRWTVRAELGAGVQLYDMDDRGAAYPIILSSDVGLVGTWQGLRAGLDMPHQAGVLSYEWALDGSALWYSKFRLRSREERERVVNGGIVYDDRLMTPVAAMSNPGLLLGTELRLFVPEFRADRLLAYIPSNAGSDLELFRKDWGTARWEPDSRHVRYASPVLTSDGGETQASWVVDAGRPDVPAVHVAGDIEDSARDPLAGMVPDHLSHCAFPLNRQFGVCVRESLHTAPEIISMVPGTGKVTILARPNAIYDEIAPLHIEAAEWVNRYGNSSTGYITFPRGYIAGRRYPVIVVTHGSDAANRFLDDGFQWEFPLQVLTERGYLVLAVNEAKDSLLERALFAEKFGEAAASGPRQVQFNLGLDAVATMEAAVQDAVGKGFGDADRAGIAGYSRGAEVVVHALSHSKVFKAGISGDGTGPVASGYWMSRLTRAWIASIYGGSPFSAAPEVQENYRRFAPSFRAAEFSGPLLQMVTDTSLLPALELDAHLQEALIPTELVYFPKESHIFWHPQRRIAAMQRTIDWFNYWLLDVRDRDPSKAEQYLRWQGLRERSARQR